MTKKSPLKPSVEKGHFRWPLRKERHRHEASRSSVRWEKKRGDFQPNPPSRRRSASSVGREKGLLADLLIQLLPTQRKRGREFLLETARYMPGKEFGGNGKRLRKGEKKKFTIYQGKGQKSTSPQSRRPVKRDEPSSRLKKGGTAGTPPCPHGGLARKNHSSPPGIKRGESGM